MTKKILWVKCDWFHDDEENEKDDESNNFDSYQEESHQSIPKMIGFGPSVIVTPFGQVNEDDVMNPIFDTDFYQGHTNFNLSKTVLEHITKVEGVEFLKIISRYRFVVGVGMLFNASEVKAEIEKSLDVKTEVDKIEPVELSGEAEQSLQCLVDEIISQVPTDKKWLAYIFPNGEHIIKIVNDETEYSTIWNNFSKLAKESNGVIISSENT